MADSDLVRNEIDIFIRQKSAKRVKNTLFDAMPTLDWILTINGHKKGADGLGRVSTSPGMMVGAHNGVANVNRQKIFAERKYRPLIQKSKPSKTEIKRMTDHDNDPVVPNWDTTNKTLSRFTSPFFHFTRYKMPYKVAHSDIRTVLAGPGVEGEAASALGNVYDAEIKTREGVLCEQINDDLFQNGTGQGYPTDADNINWDYLYSFQSALDTDNSYGGVDRSVAANSYWRSNRITSSFAGTFEDLINYCNYDLGMLKKGLGVQLIAVGGDLMKRAKAEARSLGYHLTTGKIPDMPEYGFMRETVCIHAGNRPVYIYYEPAMGDVGQGDAYNTALCLDPSTWTVAIHPESDFTISKPSDQTKVEGGDEADTGTIAAELLIACEVPSGNAWFETLPS
jgi:hypothetical protein